MFAYLPRHPGVQGKQEDFIRGPCPFVVKIPDKATLSRSPRSWRRSTCHDEQISASVPRGSSPVHHSRLNLKTGLHLHAFVELGDTSWIGNFILTRRSREKMQSVLLSFSHCSVSATLFAVASA